MKVIKEFNPDAWKEQLRCLDCEATLEYDGNDVEAIQTEGDDHEFYITCPVCQENIGIRKCSLPIPIRRLAIMRMNHRFMTLPFADADAPIQE
jgi:hypothetical protein